MKNVKQTSGEASATALEPLIAFAEANRGTYAKISQVLTARIGETQHRQNVRSWLHTDPAKRVEPRFGIGLMLLEIGAELGALGCPESGQSKRGK